MRMFSRKAAYSVCRAVVVDVRKALLAAVQASTIGPGRRGGPEVSPGALRSPLTAFSPLLADSHTPQCTVLLKTMGPAPREGRRIYNSLYNTRSIHVDFWTIRRYDVLHYDARA